jgi:pimeloyl-ACP methyl ester carboxylesterase
MVRANDVELCVQTFGDPADPAILLIAGAGAPMDRWRDEFCQRLADGCRYVVRYDHRDTGRSVSYPPGAPGYSSADLVTDAVGVLDALGVTRAHVVGISMGGVLAQLLAVQHAERVASLVLVATTPGAGHPTLPPMTPRLRASLAEESPPDWSDRAAVVDHLVTAQRRYAAGSYPFDEAAAREYARRVVDRTGDVASALTNHQRAERVKPWRERLGTVRVPTLVVHGTEDPLFPYEHGVALAAEIPGARLLTLARVGHELPRRAWDTVLPAILRHTSGDWAEQASRLAVRSLASGDPTGWFDRLYAAGVAGEVAMPWDRDQPNPMLVEWARARELSGEGRRALVVGCGLGADAEYLAGLGYDTDAFDIAETAIRVARERHPGSPVRYRSADLLDPPAGWRRAFDLVVEIYTVQALPDPPRAAAIASVAGLVAPGGTLLVIAAARDEGEAVPDPPPWPLTPAEIEAFTADGLTAVRVERFPDPTNPATRRWRAELRR